MASPGFGAREHEMRRQRRQGQHSEGVKSKVKRPRRQRVEAELVANMEGISPPQLTKGFGERRKLPEWGHGQCPC